MATAVYNVICQPTPTPTPTGGGGSGGECYGGDLCDGFKQFKQSPSSHTSMAAHARKPAPDVPPCCQVSPILIDVLGDGFSLTDVEGGVLFDFNGDGIKHQISWTAPSTDDAWLVLDRNGNGTIDSGAEMFGNATAQPSSTHRNGFIALAEYDQAAQGGNNDGQIDSRDAVFASLRLWQDVNHDGISQAAELHRLAELNVWTMALDYKESKRVDQWGNKFWYRAKVEDEKHAVVGRWAWDVYLVSAR